MMTAFTIGMRGRTATATARIAFQVGLLLCAAGRSRAADCNSLAKEAIRYIKLPGHPFSTITSPDGCWVFVSIKRSSLLGMNGVAALRRNGNGDIRLQRVVCVESSPNGMVMTHDGKLLIVADDEFVVFLDVQKMTSAGGNPVLGFLRDQRNAGSVYVNVTRDDKYLFVSDENASSISVIDLEKARTNNFDKKTIVGKIPTGIAPIALTFSPDEKLLYSTSEFAAKDWGWSARCKPEGEDPATAKIERPEGAIIIVDVEKAKSDPVNAVRGRVPAGCSPVRMGIMADGLSVWITVRNSDAVAGYDSTKLLTDPEHARIGWVLVGSSPVGLTITHGSRYVVISNSNRFGSNTDTAQTLTVIDPKRAANGKAAVVGSIEAGAFPREFGGSPDGNTIFLANYLSDTLEMIDAEHLPIKPVATSNEQPKR